MIQLSDLPWHFESYSGASEEGRSDRNGRPSELTGPAVLVAKYVVPTVWSQSHLMEDELLDLGAVIAFPAVSKVTGQVIEEGISVLPEGSEAVGRPELVVPQILGCFHGNSTPEQAFKLAYSLSCDVTIPEEPLKRDRFALGHSLGADVANGEWWLTGALSGLLGLDCERELSGLLESPTELLDTRVHLSRRVRAERNLNVQVMDAQQSATLRGFLSEHAPRDLWSAFAKECENRGLHSLASRYRRAGLRIWGSLT